MLSEEYEVAIATNGREALEILEKGGYDLMITDIVMPEQEGIETLLAAKKKHDELRVIAMSGVANKRQYLLAASFLGAKEILQKPFTIDEVRNIVKRVIG